VLKVTARPLRVLDFDIENRPLSYLGSDFTTAEVTAIAYESADLVTGHYIRGHDLPMVNGALVELGLPVLPDKMTQDTKLDFARTKGISLSQESLGAMLRLDHQKVTMNQSKWRAANRLTPEGLTEVRERVTGDVRQHLQLRRELLAKGYLAPAKLWRSGSTKIEAYVP
jgi:hypothetical protein